MRPLLLFPLAFLGPHTHILPSGPAHRCVSLRARFDLLPFPDTQFVLLSFPMQHILLPVSHKHRFLKACLPAVDLAVRATSSFFRGLHDFYVSSRLSRTCTFCDLHSNFLRQLCPGSLGTFVVCSWLPLSRISFESDWFAVPRFLDFRLAPLPPPTPRLANLSIPNLPSLRRLFPLCLAQCAFLFFFSYCFRCVLSALVPRCVAIHKLALLTLSLHFLPGPPPPGGFLFLHFLPSIVPFVTRLASSMPPFYFVNLRFRCPFFTCSRFLVFLPSLGLQRRSLGIFLPPPTLALSEILA